MDLGDRRHVYCVLDGAGEVIKEGSVTNEHDGLLRWSAKHRGALVVMEAGTHSPWISRLLREQGMEVIVANPRKTRALDHFMQFQSALLIAMTLGLAACNRLDIDKINSSELQKEAAKLIEKAKQEDSQRHPDGKVQEAYELPKNHWPNSIAVLKPRIVRYSQRGLWILAFKWVSKERGLFISAEQWRGQIDLPEAAPGVFEYHSE